MPRERPENSHAKQLTVLWLVCGHYSTDVPYTNGAGGLFVFCKRCVGNREVAKVMPSMELVPK